MNIFKKSTASEEEKKAENLSKFHGEAATSSVYNAGAAYQNPSLIASGAEAQSVALLGVFSNLVLSYLCIKAPGFIARLGAIKRSALILSLLSALVWFPLIWLFFTGTATPGMLIPLFIVSSLPVAILAPMRDSWLASLVPGSNMGRYFGLRGVITSIAYLGSFYAMGYMLDMFKDNALQGFAIIFTTAALAMFMSTVLYRASPAAIKEPEDDGFDFRDFLKEAGGGNTGAFVMFVAFFTLGVNIASPFFSVYMLRDLNFSYLTYTIVLSCEYIARIIASIFWGKYADKAGSLKVLRISGNLIPLIPILWLFAKNPVHLAIIQLISGTLWAGFDLCSQTFLYKSAPPERRLKYIMYEKSLNTLAIAAGNIAGTCFLSIVMPVFGNPILTMFLLSGIARFAVVKSMLHKLVDLTLPDKPEKKVLKPAMTKTARPAGLYYRPGEWVRTKEEPASYKVPAENVFSATTPLFRPALYEDPHKWGTYVQNLKQSNRNVRFRLEMVGIPVNTAASLS